jgi:HlyD family secretion protein
MTSLETAPTPKLNLPKPTPRRGRGRPLVKLFIGLCLLAIVAAAAAMSWGDRNLLLSMGPRATQLLSCTVQSTDLRVTVLESGTLESASSISVFSEVEGQLAIISLTPQGARVKKGDVVVELDSAALKTRRTEQQIVVEKARAALSQAKQAAELSLSQAESDVKTAELKLRFAEIDLSKYLEGDYPQELRTIQADTTLAEEELKRARDRLKYSTELHQQGYVSDGQFEADKLTVLRSEVKVELARERERLLKQFTYERRKQELDSNVQEAKRALERANNLAGSAKEQADATLRAQTATLDLEQSKLVHLEGQIAKCTMLAPQDGVVVYPAPADDDLIDLFIKQGSVIRERQHVFSIPDTDILQVTTSVHEAMVNQVEPDMPARIWLDAFPDRELAGRVKQVSPLPLPEDWRKSKVKFYETKVIIDGNPAGLKPGMSAKVEILVEQLDDVLAVPVQAVVQSGQSGACYVLNHGRPELRRVQLGKSNEELVQVVDGLAANEALVLSPDVIGFPTDALQRQPVSADLATKPAAATDDKRAAKRKKKREKPPGIEYAADLVGPSAARGEIELQFTQIGDQTEKELEVQIENGPAGETFDVVIDGVVVGQVTVAETGVVDVEWSTKDRNFPENVPAKAGPGTKVAVGDILSGTLALKPPKDKPTEPIPSAKQTPVAN